MLIQDIKTGALSDLDPLVARDYIASGQYRRAHQLSDPGDPNSPVLGVEDDPKSKTITFTEPSAEVPGWLTQPLTM